MLIIQKLSKLEKSRDKSDLMSLWTQEEIENMTIPTFLFILYTKNICRHLTKN